MNVHLEKVANKAERKKIRSLYRRAFPADERAPFWLLARKAHRSNVDWWSIYDGDTWVGFFYVLHDNDLSYVFYFAISEQCRGKGYGSQALSELKKKYAGRRIFLAIEQLDPAAENYVERVKRKQFYEKNGFTDLHEKLREANVVYSLLGIGGTVRKEEYKTLICNWCGSLLARLVRMEIVS
ncbi:MAG: GNAT family N-acetyltransferase [Eubacteriales bacterium]|nr:GNAT family N-acetyltransferase [Eubacteriales bacterium]